MKGNLNVSSDFDLDNYWWVTYNKRRLERRKGGAVERRNNKLRVIKTEFKWDLESQ